MHSKTEMCKHSLLVLDGVVTGVAHADLELEAHDGVAGALAAALPTDSLPALPAVMLQGQKEDGEELSSRFNAGGPPSEYGHGCGGDLP